MFAPTPILAAGVTSISVLFAVIAFVSWLWNVFNGNQNAGGGGARPQPQAGGGKRVEKDLQAEINRFLKNVMGQKGGQEDQLEILDAEDADARPRPRSKKSGKREAAARGNAATKADSSTTPGGARPGGHISQRKGPGSTTLGSGVRQHLAEHMQEGRVLQQTQNHLAHGVAEKVERDMGSFSAGVPSAAAANATSIAARTNITATGVAALMRDPAGLKQAFVLSLILDRPSLGRRRT